MKPRAEEVMDVVVVGGGVIGLTTARVLAKRGLSVTVLEKGSFGREASYAAGGILGPQAEADRADEFFELACQSRDRYPALAHDLLEETGIDIELDTTGTLYLALNEADENEIHRRYEWQARASLPVQLLSAADARSLEPVVSDKVRSALLFRNDIQVDNRRLLTALIDANRKLGVRLADATAVQSLDIQRDRVLGVTTVSGRINAEHVVLAAGAWTNFIPPADQIANVRITPVRGQMVCFESEPRTATHILYSPRGYLVPRRDGRVIAGSTTEHVGFKKEVTAGGIATILAQALEIAPAFSAMPITSTWSGLRPCSEDKLPVVGPSHVKGLWFATGHYRNGILLAPITAELIADLITGNFLSPLLSRFTPNRFDLVGAV